MKIAIDVIFLAIILAGVISGFRKGFVVSLMNTVSFFLAAFGSYYLSSFLTPKLYDKFFMPKISDMIQSSLEGSTTGKSLEHLFTAKPSAFVQVIDRYSTVDKAEGFFRANKGVTLTDLSRYMAEPIAQTISKVVSYIGLFLALLIVLKIITFIIDRMSKLPVVNFANKTLGLFMGAFVGLLIAWLLAEGFSILLPKLSALFPDTFSESLKKTTTVFRYLYLFDPLGFIEKLM